jgi:glycosyltransferase involved in cell wall biosynthesis
MKALNNKYKIAFLTSHVIQYQGPLFKVMAAHPEIDLTVLFFSERGAREYKDEGFGLIIKWDRELLKGYKHKFLKNYSPFQKHPNYFRYMNFGIVKEIAIGKYAAIVIYGYGWFVSWVAWLSALVFRTPILFIGETNLLQYHRGSTFRKGIKKILLKAFFSKCSAFLYLGKLNREYYRYFEIPEERMFHWPYAVDNDFFIEQKKKYDSEINIIKSSFGLPLDKVIILFAGKLVPKKCPFDILRAYAEIKKSSDSILVIAGDGMLRKEMEEYVGKEKLEGVYFLGFLNQTELVKAYAMADILVFPSYHEPWGLVLNEAMCFSLPVIVSDKISAGYDLVKDGYNGFVFETGNIKLLKDRLDILIGDKILREKMGNFSLGIISGWNYKKDVDGLLQALKFIRKLK